MQKRSLAFFSTAAFVFLTLTGAACRGGRPPSTPATPDPTAIFGTPEGESRTGGAPSEPEVTSCNHEYFPLRVGYNITYHVTHPPIGGVTEGAYATRVMRVTRDSAYLKTGIESAGGGRVDSDVEYRCIGGALQAAGYVDTHDLARGGTNQNRYEVHTNRSEGQFLPAHITPGTAWNATFDVTMSPASPDARDMTDRPIPPITLNVTIRRNALGVERVRVPAGEYEAMKIRSVTSFDGQVAFQGTEWWVKDVGMVKSVIDGSGSGQEIVTEATIVNVPSR